MDKIEKECKSDLPINVTVVESYRLMNDALLLLSVVLLLPSTLTSLMSFQFSQLTWMLYSY